MRKLLFVLLSALATGGCILGDTSHTLYLDPGGELTWIVLERHVRSDESEAARRLSEEAAYLAPIELQQHPISEALATLGASWVETRLLRQRRPFWVISEARFGRVDDMVERLLTEIGARGRVDLWFDGQRSTLDVVVDLDGVESQSEDDTCLEVLAESLEAYTIMLTAGEFVAATGFAIDGDTARMLEPDEEQLEAEGRLVLSLSWQE